MHLKTLTLRGFKSFASATTLRFEPGITCVVGPNGSGKSNVVDALAWVMGEQGAKSLRGGKMEDVIFAGTSGRAPLGRAEVNLTIDNADGALPIDYSEVTISRTLFRNGGSEYAINGASCRLLDIQDLLSDSGLGREMHVIVGQGRLDGILHATPEERRGFIEEAAGVLKHRKRKEKALRKLDAMEGNLMRVSDLTAEIRRQLGPLGKQAEVARRAQTVQADVRDARARLLADDLVQITSTLNQEIADEEALKERRGQVEQQVDQGRARLETLESEALQAAPELAEAAENWYRLSSLTERIRGTAKLAAERLRLLATTGVEERSDDRDPDELQAQADRVRESERELQDEAEAHREALDDAVETRAETEEAAGVAQRRIADQMRAVADRREGLARLAGQVEARRSKVESDHEEIAQIRASVDEAQARNSEAMTEFGTLESQAAGVEEGEEGLDLEHGRAVAAQEEACEIVDELDTRQRGADQDRISWTARKEGLELGLARKDGAGALLAADEQISGLLGSVAALLNIEPGYENAIAAALGAAAEAIAVESLGTAVDAIRYLRQEDAGRASILIGGLARSPLNRPLPSGPWGQTFWARDLVSTTTELSGALEQLLSDAVVVEDLNAAKSLVLSHPEFLVATRAGELLGAASATGGSVSAPSVLELQAALDEANEKLREAQSVGEETRIELQLAKERLAQADLQVAKTLERLHESDARIAAVAEQLGQLGSSRRAVQAEAERLQEALRQAEIKAGEDQAELESLTERLEIAQDGADDDEDFGVEERDQLLEEAQVARQREMEARLALRTCEERVRALSGRADALEESARVERAAIVRAAERLQIRQRQAETAQAVRTGADLALGIMEFSMLVASKDRDRAEALRAQREAEIAAVRREVDTASRELSELTDVVHRDEMARAEQKLRIEQFEARAIEELGMTPEVLLEEFGPHQAVPQLGLAGDDEPAPAVPFVRAEQEKRLKKAERALSLLGRVNPLALEEFAALEERHKFLVDQLNDLKKSRADLFEIVKEIDERVEQVFTEAWRDTEEQFVHVFATLFPGGEGRLILTDPSNMLTTGVDVEARPAGKKVKRLSLLSGGERSLTAIAMLVAIFKARPSPFYVMDEVEAALDDVNLGRLLAIFEELRESSQLIVVTHQKRTMEIADALYGVTMRGDGVTTVISQRLREEADPSPVL